jgi:hypothetical protein
LTRGRDATRQHEQRERQLQHWDGRVSTRRHAGDDKKGRSGVPIAESDEPLVGIVTVAQAAVGETGGEHEGGNPMGMLRNLLASGVAAKVIRELQKPQNQAKIKQAVRDFQNKNKKGGPRGRAY